MKNNFDFRCQKSAADAILHVSAGVPPEKKGEQDYEIHENHNERFDGSYRYD